MLLAPSMSLMEVSLKSSGLGSLQGEMDMELGEPQTVLTLLQPQHCQPPETHATK